MSGTTYRLSVHAPPGTREAAAIAAELGAPLRTIDQSIPSGTDMAILLLDSLEVGMQVRVVHDRLREAGPETPRIVCLRGGPDSALPLLRAGACDVLGGTPDEWRSGLRETIAHWKAVAEAMATARHSMIGSSRAWLDALQNIVEAALFCRHPVLITGENGTGKELAARLIHLLDPSPAKRDLVPLDCSTISPELSGSEFFGHERGAFTSAIEARDGAFAQADGGTLFLDEVGELPVRLQAELLRAVQEKTFRRVGGNRWHQVDFRLVAATNRDLERERQTGGFREDFYHRIAAWKCHLPPLRERRDDIIPLARHFLSQERPGTEPELAPDVRDFLLERDYPGNTRELAQLARRMAVRWKGRGPVGPGCIPFDELRPSASQDPIVAPPSHLMERAVRHLLSDGIGLGDIKEHASDIAYRVALQLEGGNIQKAARSLQVSDRSVQLFVKASRPTEEIQ